ncbi:hypothetical protein [Salinivibrio sp. HTSP]|uniref:hypothetical protein n=1 Tax=Salinivibrio sp. HTSP TaxID=2115977 RepID=UPI0012D7CD51|nr:hypothetical protein [Salinivibrio sp. HTSP]
MNTAYLTFQLTMRAHYGNDETCRINAQKGTEYHVMVRGYRSYSNVSLERD